MQGPVSYSHHTYTLGERVIHVYALADQEGGDVRNAASYIEQFQSEVRDVESLHVMIEMGVQVRPPRIAKAKFLNEMIRQTQECVPTNRIQIQMTDLSATMFDHYRKVMHTAFGKLVPQDPFPKLLEVVRGLAMDEDADLHSWVYDMLTARWARYGLQPPSFAAQTVEEFWYDLYYLVVSGHHHQLKLTTTPYFITLLQREFRKRAVVVLQEALDASWATARASNSPDTLSAWTLMNDASLSTDTMTNLSFLMDVYTCTQLLRKNVTHAALFMSAEHAARIHSIMSQL
jgi:hypothetical protein